VAIVAIIKWPLHHDYVATQCFDDRKMSEAITYCEPKYIGDRPIIETYAIMQAKQCAIERMIQSVDSLSAIGR
jgi:hypothetical protein